MRAQDCQWTSITCIVFGGAGALGIPAALTPLDAGLGTRTVAVGGWCLPLPTLFLLGFLRLQRRSLNRHGAPASRPGARHGPILRPCHITPGPDLPTEKPSTSKALPQLRYAVCALVAIPTKQK
jgi:hypothetical protein